MEQYTQQEREIDISDLLWYMVNHWRAFVVWMLVFAVFAGGYSFMKSSKETTVSSGETQFAEERIEKLRASLTANEKSRLLEAEICAARLQETEVWIEKNPLTDMDPYQVPTITLDYYVESAPTLNSEGQVLRDYSRDLINAFEAFVSDTENLSELAKLTEELTAEDMVYLLKCESDDMALNSFHITLSGTNESEVLALSDYMKTALSVYSQELQELVGEHSLILLNENNSSGVNKNIIEAKKSMVDELNILRTNLETLTASLSEKEKEIYNYDVLAGSEEIQTKKEVKELEPEVSIIDVLVGGVLGILLVSIWLVLRYVLDRRIKTVKEIERLIPNAYVGELTVKSEEKRKLFSFVDDWIDELQNWRKKKPATEMQMKILASNIAQLCRKAEKKEICVTGTSIEAEDLIVAHMAELLQEKGIILHRVDSVLMNADALEQIAATDTVLLWESVNGSRYEEFVRLLQLFGTQGVQILGAVTVETTN